MKQITFKQFKKIKEFCADFNKKLLNDTSTSSVFEGTYLTSSKDLCFRISFEDNQHLIFNWWKSFGEWVGFDLYIVGGEYFLSNIYGQTSNPSFNLIFENAPPEIRDFLIFNLDIFS